MASEFYLEVVTPERKFFEGYVEMVIVDSTDGQLGIMKGHVPMVAPVAIGIIKIKQQGVWREAAINEGFMEVTPEKTIILSHSVEWPEEIDVKRAQEALERAQERLRQKRSLTEYHRSKAALARAMSRLKVRKRYNID